jgi:hypothetical protein
VGPPQHWAKDAKIAFKAINARAETLTEKPAYPTHYLGKVHLYEFVNEPDLGGWTPQNYTAALQAAYVALKAVDPRTVMIAGSLWKWKDTAGYRTYD